MNDPLTWDASYAIALALRERYPEVDLHEVSLEMVYDWTISLPDFEDEPGLANDSILLDIYQEWFELILDLS